MKKQYGSVKQLDLNFLYADFEISFNRKNLVTLDIQGHQDMVHAIDFSLDNGVLTVEGRLPGVTDYHNLTISTSNGILIVNGTELDKSKKLTIKLSLPWDFELNLGEYVLGPVDMSPGGRLVLSSSAIMSINAVSFVDLSVTLLSVGDLQIKKISERLALNICSTGSINVQNVYGDMIAFLSSVGSLDVQTVNLPSLQITMSGIGNANFVSGTIGDLTSEVSSIGDLTLNCDIETGSFVTSGMGKINAKSCDHIVKRVTDSFLGRIDIG